MKKFTLQLQDVHGNVEKENEIVIGDNDTLIMQYPEGMTSNHAYETYHILNNALESGGIAGLPNTITFKVIKTN